MERFDFDTQAEVRWRDGSVSPVGTAAVILEWPDVGLVRMQIDGVERNVRPTMAGKLIAGYLPDQDELEEWSMASVCETPTGSSVEPDGHDEHGIPSWLLIFGVL